MGNYAQGFPGKKAEAVKLFKQVEVVIYVLKEGEKLGHQSRES